MFVSNIFAVIVLTSLAFVAQIASAADSLECIQHRSDPFESGATIVAGPHRGECINTEGKRPTKILLQNDEYLLFANFYHEGKWWVAHLPKGSVQEMIFHTIRFKTPIPFVVAAHTQLRFKLDPKNPMLIYPQDKADADLAPQTITDIIYSVEAAEPYNVNYNVFLGLFDNYGLIARVASTASRSAEEFSGDTPDLIFQLPLKLNATEAESVFIGAIRRSQQLGLDYMYNTILTNCTTELFDLMDSRLKYSAEVARFRTNLLNVFDPIDGPARRALEARQIVDKTRSLPTLNQELNAP